MISKQVTNMYHVTNLDYIEWCKENKKPAYKKSVQKEFLAKLFDGRLVKDPVTGTLTRHKREKL